MSARSIPVVWMRGGASKGLIFAAHDLPGTPRARDAVLLRALGGPDPTRRCADGAGEAGGTTRIAVVARSREDGCDLDWLLGTVAPGATAIDWDGPCDELVAAVAPYAIGAGLYPIADGTSRIRLRRLGDDARIDAYVPVRDGAPVETGGFVEDGVPYASAELRLEYVTPAEPPFPTRLTRETLAVAGLGELEVTLLDTGESTVFVRADALGLSGRESPDEVDRSRRLHARVEALRAHAAARLARRRGADATGRARGGGPVVAWVAKPVAYRSTAGVDVGAETIDLLVRAAADGRARNGCADPAALAIAVAAAVPGTVVAEVARTLPGVATRIGHAAGTRAVGADVSFRAAGGGTQAWHVDRCVLSHGARRLMSGLLHVPGDG